MNVTCKGESFFNALKKSIYIHILVCVCVCLCIFHTYTLFIRLRSVRCGWLIRVIHVRYLELLITVLDKSLIKVNSLIVYVVICNPSTTYSTYDSMLCQSIWTPLFEFKLSMDHSKAKYTFLITSSTLNHSPLVSGCESINNYMRFILFLYFYSLSLSFYRVCFLCLYRINRIKVLFF